MPLAGSLAGYVRIKTKANMFDMKKADLKCPILKSGIIHLLDHTLHADPLKNHLPSSNPDQYSYQIHKSNIEYSRVSTSLRS